MHHNLFGDILIYWDQLEFWISMSVLPPSGQMAPSAGVPVKRKKLLYHSEMSLFLD